MLVNNRSYFVVFIRDNSNGTSISARESRVVEAEIERDLRQRQAPKPSQNTSPPKPDYGELGKLVAKGDRKSFDLVLKGAQDGDNTAQFEAGCAYVHGLCVSQNPTIAAQWYERAAAGGNELAEECLTVLSECELARGYFLEFKKLVADPEVRLGLTSVLTDGRCLLSKANEVEQARILVFKISSAVSQPMEEILNAATKEV